MSPTPRRGLIGVGVAGAGLLGGYAAERALIARQHRRPDPSADVDISLRPEVRGTQLTMSDGARIRVVQQGHGPVTILLLHGITLSAAVWHFQLPALAAAGYRVVAYDQRGHGASTVGADGITLDRLAADLGEVVDQLLTDEVVLVGHSMGGMVSLRYLASAPEEAAGAGRLRALALVATSANPVIGSGIPGIGAVVGAGGPLLGQLGRLGRRLPGPSLGTGDLSFLLARVTFGADPSTSQVALTRDVTNAVPAKVAVELLAEIVSFNETPVLERIAVPATVVVGTNDLMTPVRHARAMARQLGHAELVTLDGCGHMVMLERPTELDDALSALAQRASGS